MAGGDLPDYILLSLDLDRQWMGVCYWALIILRIRSETALII